MIRHSTNNEVLTVRCKIGGALVLGKPTGVLLVHNSESVGITVV